jgi:hypothetical protein
VQLKRLHHDDSAPGLQPNTPSLPHNRMCRLRVALTAPFPTATNLPSPPSAAAALASCPGRWCGLVAGLGEPPSAQNPTHHLPGQFVYSVVPWQDRLRPALFNAAGSLAALSTPLPVQQFQGGWVGGVGGKGQAPAQYVCNPTAELVVSKQQMNSTFNCNYSTHTSKACQQISAKHTATYGIHASQVLGLIVPQQQQDPGCNLKRGHGLWAPVCMNLVTGL